MQVFPELRTTSLAGFGDAGAAGAGQVTPAVIMEALAQKENNPVVVTTLLLQRATQLAIDTERRSLSLKCAENLNYLANGSLPQRSEEHVMAWVATFRNFGTASHDVAACQGSALALRRTGGFLVACSPKSIILDDEEFFDPGCKTLSLMQIQASVRSCFQHMVRKMEKSMSLISLWPTAST